MGTNYFFNAILFPTRSVPLFLVDTVEKNVFPVLLTEPTFPVIDSTNVTIKVFDKTRKVIRVKIGSKVTTLTGTPVAIACNATGFPVPKITWMRGFAAITGSDAQSLILSPGKINLLRASRRDSGVYFCTASSPGGRISAASNVTFVGKKKEHKLTAHAKPSNKTIYKE